jgi:hypothetical protein
MFRLVVIEKMIARDWLAAVSGERGTTPRTGKKKLQGYPIQPAQAAQPSQLCI